MVEIYSGLPPLKEVLKLLANNQKNQSFQSIYFSRAHWNSAKETITLNACWNANSLDPPSNILINVLPKWFLLHRWSICSANFSSWKIFTLSYIYGFLVSCSIGDVEVELLNKLCAFEVLIFLVTNFFIACAKNKKFFKRKKLFLWLRR